MTHPIETCTDSLAQALKSVEDTNPAFMTTADKAASMLKLARLEAQIVELRLRVMAVADDVAEEAGARNVGDWYAHAALVRPEDARADYRLARGLDRSTPKVAKALRRGQMNPAQARVIVRSVEELPDEVPTPVVAQAERALVEHAERFAPRQLARIGHHILSVVAPDIADEAEAKRLATLEEEAHRRTRLTLRRLGDGTTKITGLLPDLIATRLATYLEAYANPRRETAPIAEHAGVDGSNGEPVPVGLDPVTRLSYPRRLGEAFCQLLESLDPNRLPIHGGDATSIVITIDYTTLLKDLGTAGVIAGATIPSDSDTDPTTGEQITAADARRLACNAKLIPAVLNGPSEVLDLGRAQRLFNAPQRRALTLRDRTCRAEGCDIPGTWAEAHHWITWLAGGPTDLTNAVLLCSHHHHRAHDPAYTAERLPNGDVRFTRRT